jgi:SAM-dependent methyltransferase
VFEHVDAPVDLLREVFRVLRPGGVILNQVWPLWYSEHGSHMWPFFDETWVHRTRSPEEIAAHLRERLDSRGLAESM